jgi:hypothetical protein
MPTAGKALRLPAHRLSTCLTTFAALVTLPAIASKLVKLIHKEYTMNTTDNAQSQAKAQADSIAAMVAAVNLDWDRLESLRDGDPADLDDDDRAELDDLESIAGDYKSQDEAINAIQDDPLSVEVRSSWQSVGEALTPSEFCVLLCTGGPACRIIGELDEHNQPSRAWIEYQDWGTPWTQAFNVIEQDTLLSYCSQFYFGE